MVAQGSYGVGQARDADEHVFHRTAIELTPPPYRKPLHCTGRGCDAQLVAVIGHAQGRAWVPPLFRLHPGARHAPGCPFDIDAQLKTVLVEHRDVVDAGPKVYRLRLDNDEHLDQHRPPEDEPARPQPGRPSRPARAQTGPDHRVPPVLAAARDIARLVHHSGRDPELRRLFRVVYPGGELTWDEFCWPADHLNQLADDLERHPGRPRVVYGPILVPAETTTGEKPTAAIRFDTGPERHSLSLRLRTENLELAAKHAQPGVFVLGAGTKWASWPAPPQTPREIRLWISDERHITSWTPS